MSSSRVNRTRAAWIALGVAVGIVVVAAPPAADAQRGARAEYTMVAGRVQGSEEDVLYIVDGANLEVAAFRWNQGDDALRAVGYRDVREDAQRGVGGGR